MFKWNFPYSNSCSLSLILSLGTTTKMLHLFRPPHKIFTFIDTISQSLLSFKLNHLSSLNLSSYFRCPKILHILLVLRWTQYSMPVSLFVPLVLGSPEMDPESHSRGMSPVMNRGEGSTSLTCWQCYSQCSPGHSWFYLPQEHIAGSWSTWYLAGPLGHFICQDTFQSVGPSPSSHMKLFLSRSGTCPTSLS